VEKRGRVCWLFCRCWRQTFSSFDVDRQKFDDAVNVSLPGGTAAVAVRSTDGRPSSRNEEKDEYMSLKVMLAFSKEVLVSEIQDGLSQMKKRLGMSRMEVQSWPCETGLAPGGASSWLRSPDFGSWDLFAESLRVSQSYWECAECEQGKVCREKCGLDVEKTTTEGSVDLFTCVHRLKVLSLREKGADGECDDYDDDDNSRNSLVQLRN
jgi:hypothetical protein